MLHSCTAVLPYEHVETSKRMRMRFLTKVIIQTYTTMHTYLLGDVSCVDSSETRCRLFGACVCVVVLVWVWVWVWVWRCGCRCRWCRCVCVCVCDVVVGVGCGCGLCVWVWVWVTVCVWVHIKLYHFRVDIVIRRNNSIPQQEFDQDFPGCSTIPTFNVLALQATKHFAGT